MEPCECSVNTLFNLTYLKYIQNGNIDYRQKKNRYNFLPTVALITFFNDVSNFKTVFTTVSRRIKYSISTTKRINKNHKDKRYT